jgi:hypothetical protein
MFMGIRHERKKQLISVSGILSDCRPIVAAAASASALLLAVIFHVQPFEKHSFSWSSSQQQLPGTHSMRETGCNCDHYQK